MNLYHLTCKDVIALFEQKLTQEGFVTSVNIGQVLTNNTDFLTNARRRVRRYPVLPLKLTNHAPRYRFRDVEMWVIDVIILLIQQGKVQEVAR